MASPKTRLYGLKSLKTVDISRQYHLEIGITNILINHL
ncbi:hypothetical protein C427_4302 [Paraglaciecola psychrophila 170]|uniref:Uncharacterized protein n=1 Tax=Paraglaciecola psychrophila 170 TaxID=1129794 RepID=K7A7T4_9ALTE|nr:hypothetical protein C427_4302 [Paraglaciecola psychrophila 170]GAC38362.1 hypothetical protein GPSY_2750 [Paraglaciecola psychrophila 170]